MKENCDEVGSEEEEEGPEPECDVKEALICEEECNLSEEKEEKEEGCEA